MCEVNKEELNGEEYRVNYRGGKWSTGSLWVQIRYWFKLTTGE